MGRLDRLRRADDRLGEVIRRRRGPGITRLALLVTHTGSWVTQAAIPVAAIVSATRGGSWRRAAFAASSMLGTSASFHLVKHVVQRERPHADLHLVRTNDSSFPSGHAATSAAAARVLAELTAAPKPLLAGLALGVGVTRVHLGVHHPSDVAGGFLIGWCWTSLVAAVLRPAQDPLPEPRGTEAGATPSKGPLGYTDQEWSAVAASKAAGAGHPVSGA